MVERVARAMFEVGHADAHGPDIYEEQADWWRECARAAIAALREPTEAMIAAGWEGGDWCKPTISYHDDDAPQQCWRAMIDAALTEPR